MRHKLPNTDYLRNQALKAIISGSQASVQPDDYISLNNLLKTKEYQLLTERILAHNALIIKSRNEAEQEYNNLFNKAKIYILHYLQSINMAVEREEIPKSIRTYYFLDEETGKLPNIDTPEILLNQAQKLFDSDNRRIADGGKYFTNPAIGVVKVWVDKFTDAYQKQKNLSFAKTAEIENILQIRKEIDSFIDTVWTEVAKNSANMSDQNKQQILNTFGVLYCVNDNIIIEEAITVKKTVNKSENSLSDAQFSFIFPD